MRLKTALFTNALVIFTLVSFAPSASDAQFFGKKSEPKSEGVTNNESPESFADLAEVLLPSVVNISSTQKVQSRENLPEMPELPPGSPFEDFFEEFFNRRGGGNGRGMPQIPPPLLGQDL